jgi:electron transport complex protein RnfB
MDPSPAMVAAIDALLPQTQCARCGYDGCAPYAEAIARGDAPIDRCPPGGTATLHALSALTGQSASTIDPACGPAGPMHAVVIDESRCIGCTLCIAACPVDAIIGAARRMHVVMASLCSGCERCIAPCPVDCIAPAVTPRAWTTLDAAQARLRHAARNARLARAERIGRREADAVAPSSPTATAIPLPTPAMREAAVAAALARARARRAGPLT